MITGLANQRQAGDHVPPAAGRLSIGLCFVLREELLYSAKSGSQTRSKLESLCGYNKRSISSRPRKSLESVCTGLFGTTTGPKQTASSELGQLLSHQCWRPDAGLG